MRSVVVLPQPDAPSSEKNSPAGMSRSMPLTAGTPPNALARATSEIAPPVMPASAGDRGREAGEVADEPVDVGLVVLDGQQPLLHLPPRRQEHPAVVLDEPVQLVQPVVDAEEVTVFAHRLVPEGDAPLGAHRDHVP